MKHSEVRRLAEIFDEWLSFEEKDEEINSICRSGATQEAKMVEYAGDFPQLSIVKPDVLSIKVERARRIVITKEERRSATIINALPIRLRCILTEHHKRKNRNNPETNNNWTHNDVAYLLNMKPERYKAIREHLATLVLEVDACTEHEKSSRILHELLMNV